MLKKEKLELKKSYSWLRAIRNYTQHFDIEIVRFLSQTKMANSLQGEGAKTRVLH